MKNSDVNAVEFVSEISCEVLVSSAVKHPYLKRFARGEFSDINRAYKNFALHYGAYSAGFTDYVKAVLLALDDVGHQALLQNNLDEELGHVHDADLPDPIAQGLVGVPHSSLFQRFQMAVGIAPSELNSVDASSPGMLWRKNFLALCQSNVCVGVGAVGIGTELIVSSVYQQILEGLKKHSQLSIEQRVFFDLHCGCDDEHAAQIKQIAEDLSVCSETREQIAYGAYTAVHLRTQFWDQMLSAEDDWPIDTAVNECESESV